MFTEYAFRALGPVLHFLKNKKIKDMDDDACNHLQKFYGMNLSRLDLI